MTDAPLVGAITLIRILPLETPGAGITQRLF